MQKTASFLIAVLFLLAGSLIYAQQTPLKILMIGAHPDDCDIKGAGTAALFVAMGHQVKFLSVTNGDAGHHEMGGGMLAKRRYLETQEVARRLGISYDVLDNHDGELTPTLEVRLAIIRKIRDWKADVVISHRPNDYHPDHRYTGILVQDAAYMVGVPNIAADTPPVTGNPVFLYFQDGFKKPNPFSPDIVVDITQVIDQKTDALDAHESQFYEWLPWISGYQGEIPKEKAARKEWLLRNRWASLDQTFLPGITLWYGQERISQVRYAEAFEICEYGSRPSEEDIKRLFPMLGK